MLSQESRRSSTEEDISRQQEPLGIVNDTHNNQTKNRTKYGKRLIEEELYLEIIRRPDYLEEKHKNTSLIATQCEVELLLICQNIYLNCLHFFVILSC